MNGKLAAHLVADFPAVVAARDELAIEDYEGTSELGTQTLLLYPVAPNISLFTDLGSVIKGDTIPVNIPPGVLNFSNARSATLPKRPQYSSPQFKVLFAFDAQARPTQITVGYDAKANAVVTNKECYAAIAYTGYTTKASKLIYTPQRSVIGVGGVAASFGIIAAYRPPGEVVTHQVQPINLDQGNSLTEIYRLVSEAVTTPDGQFEKPPGYPTNGAYPGVSFVLPLDVCLLTERVHELGFMDQNGRGYSNTYTIRPAKPFDSSFGYVIPTTCKSGSIPGNVDLQLKARNFLAQRGLGCK